MASISVSYSKSILIIFVTTGCNGVPFYSVSSFVSAVSIAAIAASISSSVLLCSIILRNSSAFFSAAGCPHFSRVFPIISIIFCISNVENSLTVHSCISITRECASTLFPRINSTSYQFNIAFIEKIYFYDSRYDRPRRCALGAPPVRQASGSRVTTTYSCRRSPASRRP